MAGVKAGDLGECCGDVCVAVTVHLGAVTAVDVHVERPRRQDTPAEVDDGRRLETRREDVTQATGAQRCADRAVVAGTGPGPDVAQAAGAGDRPAPNGHPPGREDAAGGDDGA